MTVRTRNVLVLALTASVVGTALTATNQALASSSLPALSWRPCAQPSGPAGQECAELAVPVDHRNPDGPRLSLAVSRLPSERPEARRGTLLVLPGGPGGSASWRWWTRWRSWAPRCRAGAPVASDGGSNPAYRRGSTHAAIAGAEGSD